MKLLLMISLFWMHVSVAEPPATEVKIIKYKDLEKIITEPRDHIKVINFWATWCAPCIKELPYFEKLSKQMAGHPVKVYLISMDMPEDADTKVKRFIERRELKSEVLLLDETDFNAFIDKVDPKWSGAIPATLILAPQNKKRVFLEKELHEGELENEIQKLVK